MLSGPAERLLTRRFQVRVGAIGARAATLVASTWDGLTSRDEDDVARFTRLTAPALTAAKVSAVAAGVGYYSTLVQFRPPSVNPRDVPIVPDPREPFIAYWNALKGGHPFEDAVLSGHARAEAVARNLATSASRQAGDVAMQKARIEVDHWERRTESGACEWCELVSTQRYVSAEAADFGHDRCGCSAFPQLVR